MSAWYEVFDNVEVQHRTRQRVAKLAAVLVALIAASLTIVAFGHQEVLPTSAAASALAVLWMAGAWWINARLRRLRQVVWCVKLSDREIVGYDYTRHQRRIDWVDVERVDVAREALVVYGKGPAILAIPKLFPDFAALSHRVIHYADFYDVPIYLEGRPWQQLNVFTLFPGLADASSSEAPPGPAAS